MRVRWSSILRSFLLGLTVAAVAPSTLLVWADEPDSEISTPLPDPPVVEPDPWVGDDEPLLAGPRLDEEGAERTIVRFDFNGGLRRLDKSPEEAALNALNLDSVTRDATDDILSERFTALDDAVRDNLDLLVELNAARQAGNKPEAASRVQQLIERLESIRTSARSWGRLRDRLGIVLTESDRRDFHRMVDEYWRAVVRDEMQQAQARKEKMTLAQAYVRVRLNATGLELRRAFERQFKSREKQFDVLLASLNLTPAQDAKIRKQVQDLLERTKGKPNSRESYDLTIKLLPDLDAAQRQTLARTLLGISPMDSHAAEMVANSMEMPASSPVPAGKQ